MKARTIKPIRVISKNTIIPVGTVFDIIHLGKSVNSGSYSSCKGLPLDFNLIWNEEFELAPELDIDPAPVPPHVPTPLKLTNNVTLYAYVDDQLFRVTDICNDVATANMIMSGNPKTAMLSEDEAGRIYLAEITPQAF